MDGSDKAVAVDSRPDGDAQPEGTGEGATTRPRTRRRRPVVYLACGVVAAVLAVVVWRSLGDDADHPASQLPHADPKVAGTPVTVGTDVCGQGWEGGRAGRLTFALWNNSIEGLEVYLQDVATKKVYLDVENLGATATRSATVDLAPGTYRFSCIPGDADPLAGPEEKVTGAGDGAATPGLRPITDNDLAPALAHYLDWVRGQLPALQRETRTLAGDLDRGDVAAAKRDWLAAHLRYETLGAAYGAFGDDDDAINAVPRTTVPAARDSRLTGFHRVEGLLWSGAPAAAADKPAHALVQAVGRLRSDLASPRLQTQEIGLRAHEILENALQFELTGRTDAGSHSSLATIDANLAGTARTLAFIRPLLVGRDPDLAATERSLAASRRLVGSYRHGGRWTPLERLTRTQRERLDADLEDTVELLSEVAVITDPRKSAGDTP